MGRKSLLQTLGLEDTVAGLDTARPTVDSRHQTTLSQRNALPEVKQGKVKVSPQIFYLNIKLKKHTSTNHLAYVSHINMRNETIPSE